jgi:hypothetical protein
MALFCVIPAPAEFAFASIIALGSCSYAVLAVDRPWLRFAIVLACFIALGALVDAPLAGRFIVALILAAWAGSMMKIRDWARTRPTLQQQRTLCSTDES